MKTGAALVLSVAGILAAGSAALAVNTQVLNVSPPGTGNANIVLLPNGAVPPISGTSDGPKATPQATGTPAGAQKAATPAKSSSAKPGSAKSSAAASNAAKSNPAKSAPAAAHGIAGGSAAGPSSSGPGGGLAGGAVTVQPVPVPGSVIPVEPGDDKGGLRKAPEPGDDSGGHGADD
ncbi:hypothetical protein [Arthrobacter sp. AFG20]|uniref:hypothetical protein n=1 Tax=Arthrobacter sp. AFG20 TaxID=1688671 RepID=UPI000C9DB322|nr:hypothetical protein [Arthrobacter sp. AFG20]PNH84259.1 hypothetical protein CXZ05_09100 [Arthrobacter sp. AFG20]